jgi:hypothetical protein
VIYTDGPSGSFAEIDSNGNKLWEYVNPIISTGPMTQGTTPSTNAVFHCNFYPTNFSGFVGKTLTATTILENVNVISDSCSLTSGLYSPHANSNLKVYPNPANDQIQLEGMQVFNEKVVIAIIDLYGRVVQQMESNGDEKTVSIDIKKLSAGTYLLKASSENYSSSHYFIKQ